MDFYNYFYKKFGVRKPGQLTNPVIAPIVMFRLPKNSVLHYMGSGKLNEVGPSPIDPIFNGVTKPIIVNHVLSVGDTLGNPRRLNLLIDSFINKFHSKNRRFKRFDEKKKFSGLNDMLMLVVYNYCNINKLYAYPRTQYSDYHRWHNFNAAVWKGVAEVAAHSDRNQFIVFDMPEVLPSPANLVQAESSGISTKTIQMFDTAEKRVILEIWKWLGENHESSTLSVIPNEKANLVNLIFVDKGRWIVVNLGVLFSWRAPSKLELKASPDLKGGDISPDQIQRRFLRLLMSEVAARSVVEADLIGEEFDDENDEKNQQVDDGSSKEPVVDTGTNILSIKPTNEVKSTVTKLTTNVSSSGISKLTQSQVVAQTPEQIVDPKVLAALDETINADLQQLDRIAKGIEDRAGIASAGIDLYDRDYEHRPINGIMAACDELAEAGRISAPEYKRYMKLADSIKHIKAPDGKTTLDKFSIVEKKDLIIPAPKQFRGKRTVIDKTMLMSTLADFDKKYVDNVLEKDLASSVVKLQDAGIAVTSYEVEKVESILGDFNSYSVQLVPVEGRTSTIKFKLPVVKEDGTFTASGNKYRLRKQVGDLPIRKVGPARVALTSYYGKTFVTRSEKKVHDFYYWLVNKIREIAFDPSDNRITEIQPGNVFDHMEAVPKLYSSMSMHFIAFSTDRYKFFFNYAKREEEIGMFAIEKYEDRGLQVIGVEMSKKLSSQLSYIAIDKDSNLYQCENGNSTMIGSIEDFLKLDSTKAPVDFAELKVMGKHIPIGIILAHELGLEKLINSLKVEYRRVPAGKRVNQEPTEFSIVFDDETLVFKRKDKLASLILGGFNEYRDAVRMYSVYEFNKRDVYLNIIESRKLTSRYLREIGLMYQLFVDPITKEILEEMNEPTTFRGLVMRACEMLLTDNHPHEMDPNYMRKKGYERFAGAVYGEVVKSIRMQRGRIDKTQAPIEVNPMAVWMAISQDPSKVMISDINPIQNLKEMEAVTFGGTGGRSTRSMVKRTREYHKNDTGVISEATSDSSDTGVNTYTTANPQFNSLRGTANKFNFKESGPTGLLSTSAVTSPCTDRDD